MTFEVFGYAVPAKDADAGMRPFILIAAFCRRCEHPIVLKYDSRDSEPSHQMVRSRLDNVVMTRGDIDTALFRRNEVWPKQAETAAPASVPAECERAFVQAERNFAARDCDEAAAIMYRRSLEIGLKLAYPGLKGSLAGRVKQLVSEHHLPSPIGDWLDQVRLIGNDSAHEIDGVIRADVEAARGFVETALRYIFTLPAQIAARRGLPAEVA